MDCPPRDSVRIAVIITIVIFWTVIFYGIGYVIYAMWDVSTEGPYVRRYNERCMRLAEKSGLMGKPESAIVPVLGKPTSVWRRWSSTIANTGKPAPGAKWVVTYNYAPHRIFPFAKFQVHMRNGVVTSLEMYDD